MPAVVVTTQSKYIGLGIGHHGEWEPASVGHYLTKANPRCRGRFQIWTIQGDPTNETDDWIKVNASNYGLGAPGDKWGAWQIMVDAITSSAQTQERVWALFDNDDGGAEDGTAGTIGELQNGSWAIWPRIPTNENAIQFVWYPWPESGLSPTTGEKVKVIPPIIRCELKAKIMRDTVRFTWNLKNEDRIDHMVGLCVYADLMPSAEDSGTRDMRNIVSIPGYPLLENRALLSGTDIPPAIEMFNSQSDPVHSIRLIFKGQGATPPDRVGVDDWAIIANTLYGASPWSYWYGGPGEDPWRTWQYEPLEYDYIDDLAYGAFWKPRRLMPGQSMKVIHYIGLACASSDFTKPNLDVPQYVAAVQGPRALKYYNVGGIGQLYPDPITIAAYMDNTERYIDLQNATFTLTLPEGLALDPSEGGKYTKALTTIAAGTEGSVSWKVIPEGSPSGVLSYSVSFSSAPVGGTTVSRQIIIPATEYQPFSAGLQMMSVPFHLSDPDPQPALGLLPGAVLWKYDTYLREYVQADKLEPGVGYWLSMPVAQSTAMTPGRYAPIDWAGTHGYQIPLEVGWNLIGNPYLYAVTLGECRFHHIDYGVLDYEQAVARGMISRTVFWWDPVFRTYKWNRYGERSIQLKPWQGYWLMVLRPGLTLNINPVSQIGAGIGGSPTEGGGGGIPTPP